ncbi:MAG: DUF3422 domain-containing protein [Pseudomonadota bacterium]
MGVTAPKDPTDQIDQALQATLVPSLLKPHRDRNALSNEAHARPPIPLSAPLAVTHLAVLSGEGTAEEDVAHVTALCEAQGAAPPVSGAKHYFGDLGTFYLKFERHTEFATYTFLRPLPPEPLFKTTAIDAVPKTWLKDVNGELLAAAHLAILSESAEAPSAETLGSIFGSQRYLGSLIGGGQARLWTDLRLHHDGFTRIILQNQGMADLQLGRFVQHVLEIDTYRMMTLLSLPVAHQVTPRVSRAEARVTDLTERLHATAGFEDDKTILSALTEISAELESVASATSYRFAASRAYADLVQRRLTNLEESPVDGLETVGNFLRKRLTPATATFDAVARRHQSLAERVGRTSSLLRTKVDIALEGQNKDLLESMNRRAEQQLALQQTVEGLSVVAISYYLIGLVAYAAKGLESAGWLPFSADVIAGMAVPLVGLAIWFGVRHIQRVLRTG